MLELWANLDVPMVYFVGDGLNFDMSNFWHLKDE